MGGACSEHVAWRDEKYAQIMAGKPEEKRPFERRKCRREDNIKMDLRKIGLKYVEWINLPQDRDRWRDFVNTVMDLRVP
jgi:hypothetical protein